MAELVPLPPRGRRYAEVRTVGLGEAGPDGRLRLDALANYLQDVAAADARDAALDAPQSWVVRRVAIQVNGSLPGVGEVAELTTWCSGIGSRWAERRTSIRSASAGIEAAAVWVSVDADGKPVSLRSSFQRAYGEAAGGRRVSARLSLGDPEDGDANCTAWRAWPLRRTDLDVLGHVNNAAYFHAAEEVREGRAVTEVTAEYRQPLVWGEEVRLGIAPGSGRLWLSQGGTIAAALELRTPPDGAGGG